MNLNYRAQNMIRKYVVIYFFADVIYFFDEAPRAPPPARSSLARMTRSGHVTSILIRSKILNSVAYMYTSHRLLPFAWARSRPYPYAIIYTPSFCCHSCGARFETEDATRYIVVLSPSKYIQGQCTLLHARSKNRMKIEIVVLKRTYNIHY